jgi:hypothetical protein
VRGRGGWCFIFQISGDSGRCYVGETGRPFEVHIKDYKYNLTEGLLAKSKLAQHVHEEGHEICWNEAVLQIKSNATYRKYREPTPMSLIDNLISQLSLEISPIWTPVIAEKKTTIPFSVD